LESFNQQERRDYVGRFFRSFGYEAKVNDSKRRGEIAAVDQLSIVPVERQQDLSFSDGATENGGVFSSWLDFNNREYIMTSLPQLADAAEREILVGQEPHQAERRRTV
jgi:hypothetical protein